MSRTSLIALSDSFGLGTKNAEKAEYAAIVGILFASNSPLHQHLAYSVAFTD
jgi:hypothetical protein